MTVLQQQLVLCHVDCIYFGCQHLDLVLSFGVGLSSVAVWPVSFKWWCICAASFVLMKCQHSRPFCVLGFNVLVASFGIRMVSVASFASE